MISLSKARFCDFSHRGYGNRFFLDWLVKLCDNSFQTPYSVSVGNFFEVRFQLIMRCDFIVDFQLTKSFCIPCKNVHFQTHFEKRGFVLVAIIYLGLQTSITNKPSTAAVEGLVQYLFSISRSASDPLFNFFAIRKKTKGFEASSFFSNNLGWKMRVNRGYYNKDFISRITLNSLKFYFY